MDVLSLGGGQLVTERGGVQVHKVHKYEVSAPRHVERLKHFAPKFSSKVDAKLGRVCRRILAGLAGVIDQGIDDVVRAAPQKEQVVSCDAALPQEFARLRRQARAAY
jgi:hypothetical protein